MTYALSEALQSAVYQHLASNPGLTALIGGDLFDALPSGTLPQTYVALGPEEVEDRSDVSGAGARHRFTVSVFSDTAGFSAAKAVAAAVCDALIDAPLTLTRGRLVGLWFERAAAERLTDGGRSIVLRFAARVEDG
jgi:hypothetical protein